MNSQEILAPVTKQANTLQNAFWYNHALVNVLVSGEQTNGRYAQLEMTVQPGMEPPMHTHSREDETYYMLEGSIEFTIGEHVFTAKKGDYVLMPKNIPHRFKVLTPTAKTVLTISPAGFEKFFCHPRLSTPAFYLCLPPAPQGPPSQEAIMATKEIGESFGVTL